MKVVITSDTLGVPVGTIMDVGSRIPRAWEGKCAPYADDEPDGIVYIEGELDDNMHDDALDDG